MFGKNALDARIVQAVIYRQDVGAGHTEDGIYTQAFHIFDDQLTNLDFHIYFSAITSFSADFIITI